MIITSDGTRLSAEDVSSLDVNLWNPNPDPIRKREMRLTLRIPSKQPFVPCAKPHRDHDNIIQTWGNTSTREIGGYVINGYSIRSISKFDEYLLGFKI